MYTNKSLNEINTLLENSDSLTFDSKIELNKELESREESFNTQNLKESINDKIDRINNLEFVEKSGFTVKYENESIRVYRTTKAIVVDIIAIVLGILLSYVGITGIFLIFKAFSNESGFQVSSFFSGIALTALGKVGVDFLNGVKRLIDYSDFELSKNSNSVKLRKRVDLKVIEIKKDKNLLQIIEDNEKMSLYLEEHFIMSVSSKNLEQKKTLHALHSLLKS